MRGVLTKKRLADLGAYPVSSSLEDYDPLLDLIGDARLVLLGEASHGTHEFYRVRAAITERLIAEKGFRAVAVEADWPDAYRINRYVRARSQDGEAVDALGDFQRFPAWMWRNADVLDFVGWLRGFNDEIASDERKVGFYGLDLYSLHASMAAVLDYLDHVDPEAAARARFRYSCFEDFGEDSQAYGYAATYGMTKSCEEEVVSQLIDLRRHANEYLQHDGRPAADEQFYVEQNARLVKNAEQYYRSMFQRQASSWNLRDRHMTETLEALLAHFEPWEQRAKIVVWEHNSHLGDARATEMGTSGQLNVGQLVRERHGRDALLVGFTTHHGTVTAATNWGGPAERKQVRPALEGSYEALFHKELPAQALLLLRGDGELATALRQPRLERAIGVIYRPESERISHYFKARLADQFDAVFHFDETRAVEPLERSTQWEGGETPETFPSGI